MNDLIEPRQISKLEAKNLILRWENDDPSLTVSERVFVIEKKLKKLLKLKLLGY